jgi:outer membrane protein assembly factor BamB
MFVVALVAVIMVGDGPSRQMDWPRIFGPSADATVPAEPLAAPAGNEDWRVVWSHPLGEGYSGPSIQAGKILLYHRIDDEEVLDCLDIETKKVLWQHKSPTQYEDQYGYNNGPRATPVIDRDVVYALGAEGKLHALHFKTGEVIWSRWLNRDYRVPQDFFGVAGSPLLVDDTVILNVGGKGSGVVGIDRETGKSIWGLADDGPSYATPVSAVIHGRKMAFVFTKAGLVAVDLDEGKLLWSIPFRSRLFESVNASTPIVVKDVVLVSATYGTGSLAIRIKPDGGYDELWRSERSLDSHFSNLIAVDGIVYGFAGRHESDCELRAIELETGKVRWSVSSVLGRGSMLKVGSQFILWGERGHLFVRELRPDAPPDLPDDPRDTRSLLTYPCWTPPALSGGVLYLRNERRIIGVDLTPNE